MLGAQVRSALSWCQRHGRALWLVEQTRFDIERVGISIPAGSIEMALCRGPGPNEVACLCGDKRLTFTPDAFLAEAKRLSAAGAAAEHA
jgi:hypothetical protein